MTYAEKQTRAGFSLVELMIAIVIIGLITAVGLPALMNKLEQAKVSKAETTLKSIQGSIVMYQADNAQLPQKLRDLVKRGEAKKWRKGGYLGTAEVPVDPWGDRYQYKVTSGGKNPYELYSHGGEKGSKESRVDAWTLD